jgi:predicted protein tyrosine phosphatase
MTQRRVLDRAMIHVCSLSRLYSTVDETGARHIVTMLRLTDRVSRPTHIAAENHLVLALDDITAPMDGYIAPGDEHVQRLIDFVGTWDRSTPMVVHCFAGISRSTAGAYVAACAVSPQRDEQEIAWEIRRASRTATPNARIVTIADRLLKRDGRMVRAIETIGPGHAAEEGVPFRINIG